MPPTSLFASTPGAAAPRGAAWFAGVRAADVVECIDVAAQPQRLTEPGFWAVVGEFDGRVRAWRFAQVERSPDGVVAPPGAVGAWRGPSAAAWTSSLDRGGYECAVARVREEIRAGEVYQANICRVLAASLPIDEIEPDAQALGAVLAAGNPAPFAGGVHVPAGSGFEPVWIVSASPELFLQIERGVVTSSPIKGTATAVAGLTVKDEAENVMITDLVRNDLQQVCVPGTVEVTTLLGVEEHPGLVHLVSTVRGVLEPGLDRSPDLWPRLLAATYPPGSVSGAPKVAALRLIAELEPVSRGPYCGAVGWVEVAPDGAVRAELAVGIRTFWWTADGPGGGTLRFGTGAGITWGSDPAAEWVETELKARRLVALASGEALDHGDGRLQA
ncbi:MAG TPA: chorismate-binding protein [Cellulomonas sp.]|uniref:chorismate-binding protein n=1 Tax=Cellulomonas sp. TaxID=40001 RepID=UPI002E2F9937|nr:chorismate-binding protein [Cellulomonas sp.]HEX5334029.1 chorismate-binding protein [Cellulomonas sp.]